MDPWVSTQIRLAERQGLLTGPNLGSVQVKAVSLCELMDRVDKTRQSETDLKQAMLTTGRFDFTDLFPEYAGAVTEEEDEEEALDADLYGGEPITYVFPAPDDESFDPDEAQRLLDELLGNASSGTVTGADLDDLP
jgi:hypothetical protein